MPRYLLDTNVVIRLLARTDPQNGIAAAAVQRLLSRGDELCVAPQVLVECWAVATRPIIANGFGWEPRVMLAEVGRMVTDFVLLEETPRLFPRWLELVGHADVRGRSVYDARLVAAMYEHGVETILTFDVADFRNYAGITAVDPSAVSP